MPVLKLFDFEDAYVQITEGGKKYYLKEYDFALSKQVSAYDEEAMKGNRAAMEMQMHLLTGIPKDELAKLGQYKINEILKFCVEMNTERKKKEKRSKK